MNVNYRLLNIDKKEHSIVVRYFTDTVNETMLATEFNSDGSVKMTANGYPTRCRTDYNLTIYDIPSPTSNAIIDIIQRSAPVSWLYMQEQIANPSVDTDLTDVEPLLGQQRSFSVTYPPTM